MAKGIAEEGGQEGAGRVRTHTRAIEGAFVCIISVSVYRSGARANQTDIIDLTCDLEIRKITDGERLEPIIIVNIGRPVSRFLAAVAVLTLPLILASYTVSLTWRRCQPTTLAFYLPLPPPLLHRPPFLSLGPSFPIYVSSSSPSVLLPADCLLSPPVRSFHLRVPLVGTRRYVLCPELLFILISWAFCFSVVSELRRKYKIIMIIMSHFARNNTVGAGIRRGSRAIRRANNVGRRGSVISRCSADPRSFLRPYSFLLSSSLSFSLSVSI